MFPFGIGFVAFYNNNIFCFFKKEIFLFNTWYEDDIFGLLMPELSLDGPITMDLHWPSWTCLLKARMQLFLIIKGRFRLGWQS